MKRVLTTFIFWYGNSLIQLLCAKYKHWESIIWILFLFFFRSFTSYIFHTIRVKEYCISHDSMCYNFLYLICLLINFHLGFHIYLFFDWVTTVFIIDHAFITWDEYSPQISKCAYIMLSKFYCFIAVFKSLKLIKQIRNASLCQIC